MVQLAVKKTGYAPEETVMIGDRLYTDVASGVNAGIDTIFVLSGEGTLDDLAQSEVRPAWTMQDISEVHSRWLDAMKA